MNRTTSGFARHVRVSRALVALVLCLGLAGSAAAQQADRDVEHAKALSRAFRKAAEKAIPTVVKISTHTKARVGPRLPGENPFRGTPFEDLFKDELPFGLRPTPREGLGSGVIIDPAGIILTNAHVVDGADEITVQLSDGREYKVKDVKADKGVDVAVLRLDAADLKLPAARFGNSDELEIGDWVIAVGNPFELEATVSAGIISAKGRSLEAVGRTALLQTDAAINPGNSGGPLLNLDGEVIGISTAIATLNGGYQGVGFAIPASTVRWVAGQLIEHGAVKRAYLGVSINDLAPEIAAKFGVRRNQGVIVEQVHPNTPAAKAGIREGDIIAEVAGQKITSRPQMQGIVERLPVGSKQPVVVLRDGKPVALQLSVEAFPDRIVAVRETPQEDESLPAGTDDYKNERLGIEVTDMPADLARRLGYEGVKGVLVMKVDVNSHAYRKGLREGMTILSVERQPVATVAEFKERVERADADRGVLLLVRVGTSNKFIVVD
ncbi:MAG: Do family serine endopeptidase [Planctomycetia bacterium]|nr:Do family serine endopeptidase [Planctomycetia bacterium]